jgi:hypothetical protein
MLDNSVQLFSVQLPEVSVKNKALVLTGSSAFFSTDNNVYSELDDLNFSYLNSNDYGLGYIDIEFKFENNFDNPYFKFYTGCFSIRTDNGVTIKMNGFPNNENYSKINKDNKVVVGIHYYFKSEKEINYFKNCNMFCAEGFIAIDKKDNVYGIMCKLSKNEEKWDVIDSNTYKIYEHQKIGGLVH